MKTYITRSGWVACGIALGVAITVLLVQTWEAPEPGQMVVEIDPEDAADLITDEVADWSIDMTLNDFVVILPATTESDFVITWPFDADGCPGDMMVVEGTGDVEIECGTLKFEDGKLVGIVGCGDIVMFDTTALGGVDGH